MNPIVSHGLVAVRRGILLLSCLAVAGCAVSPPAPPPSPSPPPSPPPPPQATLLVAMTWRERIALPPGAEAEAMLQDVSRADAPATTLTSVRQPAGIPPVQLTLRYDPTRLQPGGRYVIRGVVRVQGQLWFTSDTVTPLPPPDAPREVALMLVRATEPAPAPAPAPLVNTYWKLVELGAQPVRVQEGQRGEAHLILQGEGRVAGSGGCNRLAGGYQLDGPRLSFAQVAGTKMACLAGMDTEHAFLQALNATRSHRITGQRLTLLGADGQPLAQLEAVYLR